jgi:agmatinase
LIDPLERWAEFGEKPDFAACSPTAALPRRRTPRSCTASTSRSSARRRTTSSPTAPEPVYAPRAIRAASCPPGPHLEVGIDAFEALRIVDFGDAAVLPADPLRTHAAIESIVGEVLAAGPVPFVLGGDHAITEPSLRACAAVHGPVGMIHFDTHTDTGAEVFGVAISHGTFIRRLVDEGAIEPSRYAQIGLRGYWPGEEEFAWQAERGITSLFAHDVRDLGIREVVRRAIEAVGPGPVYLTVDVDVLDPAFLGGGTGTPEPGGMSSTELLLAVRTVAAECDLIGADVVEVIPTAVGGATCRRSWPTASCARR